jgi:hypothetical protein
MSGDRVIHTQRIADVSGEVDVHRAILHLAEESAVDASDR